MTSTAIEYDGAKLDIEYEFDKGEPADSIDPGQPPRADVHSIKHAGWELIDLLSESTIASIEAHVYWQECV